MANLLKSSFTLTNAFSSGKIILCNGRIVQEVNRVNSQRNYCCSPSKNVGFIGLGNMGHHMASHLMNKVNT